MATRPKVRDLPIRIAEMRDHLARLELQQKIKELRERVKLSRGRTRRR